MKTTKICKVDNCTKRFYARELCTSHYYINQRNGNTKGRNHGYSKTPGYQVWRAMKQRCINLNDAHYSSYGGRGITVCDRWKESYLNFLEDMGLCPDGLTLDRINNNGNYSLDNCRWATRTQQCYNQRGWAKSATKIKGVYETSSGYMASIGINKKSVYLGSFRDKAEAQIARKLAENKIYKALNI